MSAEPSPSLPDSLRLERGALLPLDPCPFPLPSDVELAFLRSADVGTRTFQDIQFDPITHRLTGVGAIEPAVKEKISEILARFSVELHRWLQTVLPEYADGLFPDQATLRVHEEAIRSVRHSSRSDLLHIDSFPTRPTSGRRVLRIGFNFNDEEPRVWATGDTFASILRYYADHNRVPIRSMSEWQLMPQPWQRLLQGDWSARTHYDAWMHRLEEYLKADEKYQETTLKRYWHFEPFTGWMFFSDGISHAVMRGQFAIEHTFFVEQSALTIPELSPLAELVKIGLAKSHSVRRAG